MKGKFFSRWQDFEWCAPLFFQLHEIEGAWSDEQRRHGDTQKSVRKADKRIKELIMQVSSTIVIYIQIRINYNLSQI